VSPHDFETALTGRGHFESCFLEEVFFLDLGFLTTVFTVTFAYIDDYRDAIKVSTPLSYAPSLCACSESISTGLRKTPDVLPPGIGH
jgi:hypothetical protein